MWEIIHLSRQHGFHEEDPVFDPIYKSVIQALRTAVENDNADTYVMLYKSC